MKFYDFKATTMSGKEISMSELKNKVVLVVNTASKCGFSPQFKELEELNKKYKDQGLVILGFPCGQFANQEFDNNKKIEEFCQLNYGVTFTMFEKIDVNGKNTHPLFKFLKNKTKSILSSTIKWNFTKFLISKDGEVIKRYAPITSPVELIKEIEKLLE